MPSRLPRNSLWRGSRILNLGSQKKSDCLMEGKTPMPEKPTKILKLPYKDADLPTDDLSLERALEIEEKIMPKLLAQLEELRKKNPEIFEKQQTS